MSKIFSRNEQGIPHHKVDHASGDFNKMKSNFTLVIENGRLLIRSGECDKTWIEFQNGQILKSDLR